MDNQKAMEILKEAYRNNYKGKFTDLLAQADPQMAQQQAMMQEQQQTNPEAPHTPVEPYNPVTNPNGDDMILDRPDQTQQGLVQSYESQEPTQTPTGEPVRDVLNPGEYRKGGFRLIESLPSYQKGMSTQASDYVQGYKRKYEEGGQRDNRSRISRTTDKYYKDKIRHQNILDTKKISLDVNPIKAVKNVFNWKENLAENLYPVGYQHATKRVFDAVVNDKAEQGTKKKHDETYKHHVDYEGTEWENERVDLMNMMLNKPQVHNTISESQYRPTKSKNKDAVYYSSKKTEDEIREKIRNKMLGDIERDGRRGGSVLGTYTLDRGKDEDGREYISYYDKWNINPTKGLIGDKTIDKIFGLKSPEIYGRVYLDEMEEPKKKLKQERKGHIKIKPKI